MRLLFPVTTTSGVSLLFVSFFCSSVVPFSAGTDSLGRVNFITKLPFAALVFLAKESHSANVWIPEEPPKDRDGSVKDELAEVATVFAKPDSKVVEHEPLPSEAAVPWTSLKQEWDLYKRFHENKNRRQGQDDEESGEEDEEEEEEEEGDAVDKLPQAFYGQQNGDDDEKDFLQKQKDVYTNKKNKKTKVEDNESDEEEEEEEEEEQNDDVVAPSDISGLENLTDDEKQAIIDKIFADSYAAGGQTGGQPLGPSSTPQQGHGPPQGPPQTAYRPPGSEDSEEDQRPLHPQDDGDDSDEDDDVDKPQSDLTQPKKKGETQNDDGGHGKKDKKKKKKKKKGKKKGGGGWGWKKPVVIPIPDPGWGWKKHDGLLEQLVKGSTWERVLSYYHSTNDASEKDKKDQGWGWGEKEKPDLSTKLHDGGEKLVTKLFKGSFWDRAFQTYSQYKKDNVGKHPNKEYDHVPLTIDW